MGSGKSEFLNSKLETNHELPMFGKFKISKFGICFVFRYSCFEFFYLVRDDHFFAFSLSDVGQQLAKPRHVGVERLAARDTRELTGA